MTFGNSLLAFLSILIIASMATAQPMPPSPQNPPAQVPNMPQEDPTRLWLGSIYADTIIAAVKKNNPHLQLVVDLDDLELKEKSYAIKENIKLAINNYKELAEESFVFRAIDSARLVFPPKLATFIHQLEFGEEITYLTHDELSYERLKEWIYKQPNESIYPHQLMAKALELENGHVLSAWTMVWNFTSDGWASTANRNYDVLRSRFASLTGERHLWNGGISYVVLPTKEHKPTTSTVYHPDGTYEMVTSTERIRMEVSKRGDEFSYLYHRIGVELLSLVISKITGRSYVGQFTAKLGGLSEWLKYPKTSGLSVENKKRVGNDIIAADSGSRIFEIVENKKPITVPETQINPSTYLKSDPSKFNSRYQMKDDRPAVYFGSSVAAKFWAPTMSIEELILRFHHAVKVDSEIFNPVYLAANGEYERLHRGLVDYQNSGAKNIELNKYMKIYLNGDVAVPLKPAEALGDIDNGYFGDNKVFAKKVYRRFSYSEMDLRLGRLIRQVLTTSEQSKKVFNKSVTCEKVHLVNF